MKRASEAVIRWLSSRRQLASRGSEATCIICYNILYYVITYYTISCDTTSYFPNNGNVRVPYGEKIRGKKNDNKIP